MYLDFFKLRECPFGIPPDPAYLFMTPSHREALASILYGIDGRKGFIKLTGEVGTGKTILLKSILDRLDPKRVQTAYMFNPELRFEELIRALLRELDIASTPDDPDESIRRLHRYLIAAYSEKKKVVLFVDEAQRMPVDTLEKLRVLSNLESRKDKLLQIVLCGQPELDQVLAHHDLRQLRQRIAVSATLCPLTTNESVDYILHRVGRAGYGQRDVFTPRAMKSIARYAGGIPRSINILCEHALISGYAQHERPVSSKHVKEARSAIRPDFRFWTRRRGWAAAALFAVVGAGVSLNTVFPERRGAALTGPQPHERASLVLAEPPVVGSRIAFSEHLSLSLSIPVWDPNIAKAAQLAATTVRASVDSESMLDEPVSDEFVVADEGSKAQAMDLVATTSSVDGVSDETDEDPGQAWPLKRLVQDGDSLFGLIRQVYGRTDPSLMSEVLKQNPSVVDKNRIRAGEVLFFPAPDPGR